MGFDFRMPNITGNDREQLAQIKSYLYQFVPQLQWALNTLDASSASSYAVSPTPKSNTKSTEAAKSDDREAAFNDIKAIIIKSADIVNAYYEEMNKRFESDYVAVSDFGTFAEKTAQDIEANATEIKQVFTNVQQIDTNVKSVEGNVVQLETNLQDTKTGIGANLETLSSEVGQIDTDIQGVKAGIDTNVKELTKDIGDLDTSLKNMKDEVDGELKDVKDEIESIIYTLVEVNASIKSGLLYYDDSGIPIYGLEIGQRNTIDGVEVFNKFARFTSDRLSFYDKNGNEVAYISDYKLHITNAEIMGTLKLGAFLLDTTKGFRLKWVGRG